MSQQPKISLTLPRDTWTSLSGLLTNIARGRFKLVDTEGDAVNLVPEEEEALALFRKTLVTRMFK